MTRPRLTGLWRSAGLRFGADLGERVLAPVAAGGLVLAEEEAEVP